jgi:hypothetical protein
LLDACLKLKHDDKKILTNGFELASDETQMEELRSKVWGGAVSFGTD